MGGARPRSWAAEVVVEDQDEILTCVDCDDPFVFAAGERAFFIAKGFVDNDGVIVPTRCHGCRAMRKRARQAEARERTEAFD